MKSDTELKNPVAELNFPESGELINAKNAIAGRTYYCPDPNCGDPQRRLFLKQSVLRRKFFSHHKDYEHVVSGETLLHKLAVRYFKSLEAFELPALNGEIRKILLDKESTQLEYNGLKTARPDVKIVTLDGDVFLIEIFVTHNTKGKKLSVMESYKIPAIEIDLNGFYRQHRDKCREEIDFIHSCLPRLIEDRSLKKWLFNSLLDLLSENEPRLVEHQGGQEKTKKVASKSLLEDFVVGAILGAVGLLFIPSFRNWLMKSIGLSKNSNHRKRKN